MNLKRVSVGLANDSISCIPDSIETFLKCVGHREIALYALQAISIGRPIRYVVVDQFSSQRNFLGSFVDNLTLLGQLSAGIVDWIPYDLVVTKDRANHLSFSIPTSEDKYCFFMGRKWLNSGSGSSSSTYFLTVFGIKTWLFFGGAQLSYLGLERAIRRLLGNHEFLPWFRRFSFGLASICFILAYNVNLKMEFMPTKTINMLFSSVGELAELVKTKNYRLVINSMEDFRMEMINHSNSVGLRALKEALAPNKIILVKSDDDMWKTLPIIRGSFTPYSWANFLNLDQHKVHDIVEVCPDELPKLNGAFAFSKNSKFVEVFNQRIHFVSGLTERLTMVQEESYKYHAAESSPIFPADNPVPLKNTGVLFILYCILVCVSVLVCCVEYSNLGFIRK